MSHASRATFTGKGSSNSDPGSITGAVWQKDFALVFFELVGFLLSLLYCPPRAGRPNRSAQPPTLTLHTRGAWAAV